MKQTIGEVLIVTLQIDSGVSLGGISAAYRQIYGAAQCTRDGLLQFHYGVNLGYHSRLYQGRRITPTACELACRWMGLRGFLVPARHLCLQYQLGSVPTQHRHHCLPYRTYSRCCRGSGWVLVWSRRTCAMPVMAYPARQRTVPEWEMPVRGVLRRRSRPVRRRLPRR